MKQIHNNTELFLDIIQSFRAAMRDNSKITIRKYAVRRSIIANKLWRYAERTSGFITLLQLLLPFLYTAAVYSVWPFAVLFFRKTNSIPFNDPALSFMLDKNQACLIAALILLTTIFIIWFFVYQKSFENFLQRKTLSKPNLRECTLVYSLVLKILNVALLSLIIIGLLRVKIEVEGVNDSTNTLMLVAITLLMLGLWWCYCWTRIPIGRPIGNRKSLLIGLLLILFISGLISFIPVPNTFLDIGKIDIRLTGFVLSIIIALESLWFCAIGCFLIVKSNIATTSRKSSTDRGREPSDCRRQTQKTFSSWFYREFSVWMSICCLVAILTIPLVSNIIGMMYPFIKILIS